MWMVDPSVMCKQHLLGEHCEIHMLIGTINKRKSLKGYVDNGLIELRSLQQRHEELVKEMIKRNINHKSILKPYDLTYLPLYIIDFKINKVQSYNELKRRCKKCFK